MIIEKITQERIKTTDWSGGKTSEIIIDPPNASYADRSFNFRMSSATVALYESDFTPLPDYNRIIAPLNGRLFLYYNSSAVGAKLEPLELTSFDGAAQTKSRGRVVDFNLMTRKGVCVGASQAYTLNRGQAVTIKGEATAKTRHVVLVYCTKGALTADFGGETVALQKGEALKADFSAGEAVADFLFQSDAEASVIFSTVNFVD